MNIKIIAVDFVAYREGVKSLTIKHNEGSQKVIIDGEMVCITEKNEDVKILIAPEGQNAPESYKELSDFFRWCELNFVDK